MNPDTISNVFDTTEGRVRVEAFRHRWTTDKAVFYVERTAIPASLFDERRAWIVTLDRRDGKLRFRSSSLMVAVVQWMKHQRERKTDDE